MVETHWPYTGLVALVGIERLIELSVARRNQGWLTARGAVEVGAEHYPWMVWLHLLFLASCVAEVWWLHRPFNRALAVPMLVLVILAMLLRYWVIATLGRRWTTRVLCLPGESVIDSGPYRFLRHPNYLAVVMEIFALPLVHSAWLTATLFTVVNGWLLRRRIRVEEAALQRYSGAGGE